VILPILAGSLIIFLSLEVVDQDKEIFELIVQELVTPFSEILAVIFDFGDSADLSTVQEEIFSDHEPEASIVWLF
jgi:hypothetical protein